MKKIALLLVLLLTVGVLFLLASCGDNPNGGDVWVETPDDAFLYSAADCENAAVYYKSSPDGKKIADEDTLGEGNELTFTYGSPLGHNYPYACSEKCTRCSQPNPNKVAHTFPHACTEKCTVCNANNPNKVAHVYDEGVCDEDCNVCGKANPNPHLYELQYCSEYCICGDVKNPNYKPYEEDPAHPGVCKWCHQPHSEGPSTDTGKEHATEPHIFKQKEE